MPPDWITISMGDAAASVSPAQVCPRRPQPSAWKPIQADERTIMETIDAVQERFPQVEERMSAADRPPGVKLYELAFGNGMLASPFAWRVRLALAHKSIPFESVPLGFTEIPTVLGPELKTVPVLEDRNGRRGESWEIVEYLEREYPQSPPLFAGSGEHALARFFDGWFSIEIMQRMFALYALDIYNAARPVDRAYFRASREARIGQTLEAFTAAREARLPALRDALGPLRWHLKRRPFIAGEAPGYADFIALGGFIWVGSVCTLPVLAKDDALGAWLDRSLNLYGGMARDARLKPLQE